MDASKTTELLSANEIAAIENRRVPALDANACLHAAVVVGAIASMNGSASCYNAANLLRHAAVAADDLQNITRLLATLRSKDEEIARLRLIEARLHAHVRERHAAGELSEGTIAHLCNVDRLTAREILDTENPCNAEGPGILRCSRDATHPGTIHWGHDSTGARFAWDSSAKEICAVQIDRGGAS
jgi:hypothetical protein